MEFKNKVAVITGASRGIGCAISKRLVAEGMKVYCLSRTKPAELVDGVTYLYADVSKAKLVAEAVTQIVEPVDLLINNAGVMRRGNYWEITEEEFDLVMSVDMKGPWLMFKYLRDKLAKGAMTLQSNSKNSLQMKENTFAYTLAKLADLEIDKLVAKDRPDLDMRVAHFGPVDTLLEWTDYSEEEKAEKMKIAIQPDEAADWTMKLIKSDQKRLVYDVESKVYMLV